MNTQTMADEWALRRLSERGAIAVDTRDMTAMLEAYWPEASVQVHPIDRPDEVDFVMRGETELRLVADSISHFHRTFHMIVGAVYDIAGDRAHGRLAVMAHHLAPTDGCIRDFLAVLRYHDRYERRQGEWRILERHLYFQWTEERTLPPGSALGLPGLPGEQ